MILNSSIHTFPPNIQYLAQALSLSFIEVIDNFSKPDLSCLPVNSILHYLPNNINIPTSLNRHLRNHDIRIGDISPWFRPHHTLNHNLSIEPHIIMLR